MAFFVYRGRPLLHKTDGSVRQSVTLPAKMATQARSMAKRRCLSVNRMVVEKEKVFFGLTDHFRAATDPNEIELDEEIGQMAFDRSSQTSNSETLADCLPVFRIPPQFLK